MLILTSRSRPMSNVGQNKGHVPKGVELGNSAHRAHLGALKMLPCAPHRSIASLKVQLEDVRRHTGLQAPAAGGAAELLAAAVVAEVAVAAVAGTVEGRPSEAPEAGVAEPSEAGVAEPSEAGVTEPSATTAPSEACLPHATVMEGGAHPEGEAAPHRTPAQQSESSGGGVDSSDQLAALAPPQPIRVAMSVDVESQLAVVSARLMQLEGEVSELRAQGGAGSGAADMPWPVARALDVAVEKQVHSLRLTAAADAADASPVPCLGFEFAEAPPLAYQTYSPPTSRPFHSPAGIGYTCLCIRPSCSAAAAGT